MPARQASIHPLMYSPTSAGRVRALQMIRCLENFEAGSFSVGKVKNLRAGRTGPKAWLHDLLPGRKGPLQQPTKPKLMSSIPRLVVSTAVRSSRRLTLCSSPSAKRRRGASGKRPPRRFRRAKPPSRARLWRALDGERYKSSWRGLTLSSS